MNNSGIIVLGLLVSAVHLSCNRLTDHVYKDYTFVVQNNDSLYLDHRIQNLPPDKSRSVIFLHNNIDSVKVLIKKEMNYLDSLQKSNHVNNILFGTKNTIKHHYSDGLTERRLNTLLIQIDSTVRLLDQSYYQAKFDFLPADSILLFGKMPLSIQRNYFKSILSSITSTERQCLLQLRNNQDE
jgi:hypothetical protein